jgi:omega-amidase
MRVTTVQTTLFWEDKLRNLSHFEALLAPLAGQTDLILLPEMFTTGFSMEAARLSEPMDGSTVTWMHQQAASLNAAVCGSFICVDGTQYYNRFVFMRPDGQYHTYDKRHLFRLAGEDAHFAAGHALVTIEWRGWRIRPLICYDLRFPVWSRQPMEEPYDLLVYVANWPAPRAHHWRSLLSARAVENQTYVAATNIVGTDGPGRAYVGDSGILDFHGQWLGHLQGSAGVLTLDLDQAQMTDYRTKLPFLKDADRFEWRD